MQQIDLDWALRYRSAIWGRMMAEHASSLEDDEIERVLTDCVGGHFLVPMARMLRDHGLIELIDNPPYARNDN